MKKLILFGIIIALFITNFIYASEENSFNGGDGQYLISQTPGDIQNSPFRSIDEGNIKTFGITGEGVLDIPYNFVWWIPLIGLVFLIILCICKRKKIKKLFVLIKKGRRKDEE